jgi:transposase
MGKQLVTDELWEIIEPLLPKEPPKLKGGRPRVPNRAVLTGIVFVLKSGIPWGMLPIGDGLRQRVHVLEALAGVAAGWRMAKAAPGALRPPRRRGQDRLVPHLFRLGERGGEKGGEAVGKNPTDRGKPGSRRHVMTDGAGVPLAVVLTAANVHDSMVFERVLDCIEPIKHPSGTSGRRRKRPEKLHADKGYDFRHCREALRRRGIRGRIARRGKETSERMGRHRWVVERTLAWLARYRRLAVRYERQADMHEAFLHLGCSLICLNHLS